ncbi:DUF3073 family protein [Actinomadura atramentaria]|uniref:DUF3073 family protein n=1 Tax=Actinomadura atramentaria TaxID=1990 RepID=UPI00037DE734|nr:DUF3073 family protein [Actinomadura atramentaria]
MGRGRAKAKQQRDARKLKYRGAGDLDGLCRELGVGRAPALAPEPAEREPARDAERGE